MIHECHPFKSHLRDIICGYFFKKGHTVCIVHIQGVHDGDDRF